MGRPDPDARVRSLGGLKEGSRDNGFGEDEGLAFGGPVLLLPCPDIFELLIDDQPREHAIINLAKKTLSQEFFRKYFKDVVLTFKSYLKSISYSRTNETLNI